MPTQAFSPDVQSTIVQYVRAAKQASTIPVLLDGDTVQVPYPYPSPTDWRDCWIYFLMIDRFNNPAAAPKFTWNKKYGFRQGGTFEGVRMQLPYLQQLGVTAIWLSPVLKNTRPEIDGFAYAYPGYNTQDYFNLEDRFSSDGTQATAERELQALVQEAHARGIYVIVDIVLNHAGRIFDYVWQNQIQSSFTDATLLYGPPGNEPSIQWMNGFGTPRADWQDAIDPSGAGQDDAVWPLDFQRPVFFRRRGSTVSDSPGPQGFVAGDFSVMRQLVVEYDASVPGQEQLREQYGVAPVLGVLIRAYQYLMAKYDVDGYRIDTVKYVRPDMIATFGNAMREFALGAGKRNFFTFGEIYDQESLIDQFVGRNAADNQGFGIDSALDYPLFYQLPPVIKALGSNPPGVETIATVFNNRKLAEENQISSHGEAGKYFVSFIDNHDQNSRFNSPGTPPEQVTMALALIFGLQGIPCVYYGTEQGLQGTIDGLDALESVREALWGKSQAFDPTSPFYVDLQKIAAVRMSEPPLCYGRLYFREVSGNGTDFGQSVGAGGVVAFSRILSDREVLIVANTNGTNAFTGKVLVDIDLSRTSRVMNIVYSNKASSGAQTTSIAPGNIYSAGQAPASTQVASLAVSLAPWEVQILAPQ
ncbi:MAG TPA: alpha-amylase family glycosyl hydrolase [Alloacidobacterium sp.]|nr:alpha-amylase family glycosyl hydrolase [Alloacidobacterium sp.]